MPVYVRHTLTPLRKYESERRDTPTPVTAAESFRLLFINNPDGRTTLRSVANEIQIL